MKTALLLAAALATQCNLDPKPAPPAPPPDPFAATCETACKNLMAMNCHDGNPTKEGASCVEVCQNAERNGLPLPVACVTVSGSCEEAAQCEGP